MMEFFLLKIFQLNKKNEGFEQLSKSLVFSKDKAFNYKIC